MSNPLRVYVAGPYSAPDHMQVLRNIRRGQNAAKKILDSGHYPFCPFIDYQLLFHGDENTSIETLYKYSLAFLEVCDVMIMLPGYEESKGCKGEIEFANEKKIPIVYVAKTFNMYAPMYVELFLNEVCDGFQ